ncbi:MAG: ATP-binding cassette domain-containing protein [Eubacterium sp.]|nr:ATP-binding cassette domain-containing protein [Eubacterium sp.]
MDFGINATELEVLSGEKQRLKKVSFCLKAGEHAVVTGASGSGKTTLLRVLAGLHTDYHGEVVYRGEAADRGETTNRGAVSLHKEGSLLLVSPSELLRKHGLSVLFQENRLLPELSAVENIRIALPKTAKESTAELKEKIRGELARILQGVDPEKPVRKLSGGEQRRVALARAMVQDAPVILLDEPFTGLDAASAELVRLYISERGEGRTILLTEHEGEHFPDWKRIEIK